MTPIQLNSDIIQLPIEIEEYFAIIHILSILSRAIIFAYNNTTNKSNHSNQLTLKVLLSNLPPGTKSDIANSLLESIEYLSLLWKKRFDLIEFQSIYVSKPHINHENNEIIHNEVDDWFIHHYNKQTDTHHNHNQIMIYHRARFLLNEKFIIPLTAFFQCITDELLIPNTVDDVLNHLFE